MAGDSVDRPPVHMSVTVMRKRLIATVLVLIGCAATPAWAQAAAIGPEHSSLLLFGLGIAGVVIGRQHGHSRAQ